MNMNKQMEIKMKINPEMDADKDMNTDMDKDMNTDRDADMDTDMGTDRAQQGQGNEHGPGHRSWTWTSNFCVALTSKSACGAYFGIVPCKTTL
jgi:hypothetical protein